MKKTRAKKHLLISSDWIFDLSMFVLLWSIIFLGMMLRYLMFVQLFEDPQRQRPLWFIGNLYRGICWQPLITNTYYKKKRKEKYDAMKIYIYEAMTNLLLFLTTTVLATQLTNIYFYYLSTLVYWTFTIGLDSHYMFDIFERTKLTST